MGLKRFIKKVRRTIKKIIPKEIRPALPFIAAAMGPGAFGLAGTKFAALNPAFQKALIASGTKLATDDEADLKDGLIYFKSPIGKGLIGKNKLDLLEIKTPSGIKNFEVVDFQYI